jgi:serine protease Do
MVRALVALAMVASLAVPVAAARPYSWLGVRIRDLAEPEMDEIAARHGIREGFGVFIVDVLDGTPAAKAGVRRSDVVVALDRRPVTDGRMLQRLIAQAPLDKDVTVTVLRSEGRKTLTVRLAPMPRPAAGDRIAAEFGFSVRSADTRDGSAPEPLSSVPPTIVAVQRGSAAEKAGLEVGDVIIEVGDQGVISGDAARDALADAPTERPLRLTVRRGGHRLSLTVPPALPGATPGG